MKLLLTASVLVSGLLLLLMGTIVRVQAAEPVVTGNEALVDFPHTVTFRLDVQSELPLSDAKLTYQVGRDSCLDAGTQVPVEIDGTTLEWTWVMSRSGNPPPGAQMWWEWTVTDTSGNTVTTPRQELTFSDDRFPWRTVVSDADSQSVPIRLHWYEGDEVGPILLDAAVAGLDRLQNDTGIELQGEVQLFIYGSAADMREALLYVQDWAGGAALSDYNVILMGVPPHLAESWGSSTVRHEMAHLLLGQFGRSCLGGSRPTWLEEGLATYAEGEPDESTVEEIEESIRDNSFRPVRSLNGAFPAQDDRASAAYSQSYSLVAYLLDTYGQEKIQELILTLAEAESYDAALEQVYGYNVDGLEVAWRAAIGAAPRQIPATPTPILAENVPTIVPLDAGQSRPTPETNTVTPGDPAPDTDTDASTPASGLCNLGLAPALLFLGVIGRINLRRRRKATNGGGG